MTRKPQSAVQALAGALLICLVASCGGGGGGGGGGPPPPPPPPPPPMIGRNDSVATATPLGNGNFAASISPSGHPNTVFSPDQDFYRITTTADSTVTIDINAQVNGSPIDSVIEIVNINGNRLNTCVAPTFNSACVHDDEVLGVTLDSFLQIQVNGPTTFYVHVVDWRFDARPDLTYNIVISGVI